MNELILLILGLIGLVLGTHLVIKASLNIAQHYKISTFFIGLTILSIGTDLPELVVDIRGALYRLAGTETSGLILGETVGTCMGQIALTLGILALFGTLILTKRELKRDALMMLVSVFLLFLVGSDGVITRLEGVIFMIIYVVYFYNLYREEQVKEKVKKAPPLHLGWDILSLVAGFIFLVLCSDLVVKNGIGLATLWGVPQATIGAVVLGLGTSLPELAVTLGGMLKGAFRLSVGNLIGSNIFDVLFTVGIASAISGFNVSQNILHFDIPFLFLTSLIVVLLFAIRKKINIKEAGLLIALYITYVVLRIFVFSS